MFAPRRVPPCFTVSVAASNTVMKEIGPDETPFVDFTTSFFGRCSRRRSPSAARLVDERRVLHGFEDLVHGVATGSTKQADSWPVHGRVHERRAVRQELQRGHETVELVRGPADLLGDFP